MTRQSPRELLDACGALVLDFDDTVAATFAMRSGSLARALGSFGVVTSPARIAASWGLPFEELLAQLAPQVTLKDFLPRYAKVMAAEPPRLLPGVLDLLTLLAERGVPVVVHTSGLTELVRQDVEALGLTSLLADVYGSDRTGRTKPDPGSLRPVLDLFADSGPSTPGILYSGDSLRDLAVADGNGLAFLGVLTGQTTRLAFRAAGFNGAVVDSYAALFR